VRRDIQQDVEVPRNPEQEGHHQRFGAVVLGEVRLETSELEPREEPPCHQNCTGDDHCTVRVLVDLPSDGGKVGGHGGVVDAWTVDTIGEGIHEGGKKGEQVR